MTDQLILAILLLSLGAVTIVSTVASLTYVVRLVFFRHHWRWYDDGDFAASVIVMAWCCAGLAVVWAER